METQPDFRELLALFNAHHEIDLAKHSSRIANATAEERARFEVSPTGYGIHWPDIDEDLSINGLLSAGQACPAVEAADGGRAKQST